ncbi:Glyoxalase/Bleomycin resistance protein/Dihydroxybiphenyl dioxygenase [Pavlovales sp. CCMP2436]|nr:Glyoxalase/Bleomycin resistance protein/Dihydroxybiphenyl dioxygenase [Pavlovales sp. CCMP2436]
MARSALTSAAWLTLAALSVGASVPSAFCSPLRHAAARVGRSRPRCVAAAVDYGGIQHAGVLVSDTAKSLAFYTEVLGMGDDTQYRPATLSFAGAFVRCGTHQLHLMELPNPDPTAGRPEHGGRDRHLAITVQSIEPLKASLEAAGVPYTMSMSGRLAVFCRDPDGNALEFLEATAVRAG